MILLKKKKNDIILAVFTLANKIRSAILQMTLTTI